MTPKQIKEQEVENLINLEVKEASQDFKVVKIKGKEFQVLDHPVGKQILEQFSTVI